MMGKKMINKGYIDNVSFSIALLLSLIGILFIYSSESNQAGIHFLFLKQFFSLIISLFIYFFFARLDYHYYASRPFLMSALGFFLLIIVLFFGKTINGSKSWVSLGFFHLQLAEFTKLIYIVVFTNFINRFQDNTPRASFFFVSLGILTPFLLLIFAQPDFGTGAIFITIFISMVFLGGGNVKILLILAPIGFLMVAFPFFGYILVKVMHLHNVLTFFIWENKGYLLLSFIFGLLTGLFFLVYRFLAFRVFMVTSIIFSFFLVTSLGGYAIKHIFKDYHYKRILTLINPSLDPGGKGYNVNQSFISIGSGKLFGYGLTKGPQNRGNFLPAKNTDFILALIAEEWGFFGISLILLLNTFLIYRIFQIASESNDFLGYLIAVGILSLFTAHFVINIFSVVGFLPVIGIPLPFVSYGGSSLFTNYAALGMLYNIRNNRYYN